MRFRLRAFSALISIPSSLASLALALAACPSAPPIDPAAAASKSAGACAGLDGSACSRVDGLLRAASGFGNVHHEYLLDPASSMVPGRGVVRSETGTFDVLPTRCADERTHGAQAAAAPAAPPRVDASTIDFSYVGVSIDHHLVSADAELLPWASVGAEASEKKISLVAVAFVRDLDPQFFGASSDVSFAGTACACGRATHFVGSVKMGGIISYDMTIRAGELRGHALDFFKSRIAAGDTRISQTVVGGLEVEGLEAALAASGAGGGAAASTSASSPASALAKPLSFHVKNPVPVAYAVYPLADVCRFAFPAPEVSPEVVEFGDVPYGREESRLLHVVNRASIDLRAAMGDRTFAIPALGSLDIPVAWTPNGQGLGCERQERQETLQFTPRDEATPVTPKTQSVRVTEHVRTGKPTFTRHEHVDTGVHAKPDYAGTKREWTCPPDYAVATCRTEKRECSDGKCATDGYAVNAEPNDNGCRFSCRGPEGFVPGLSSNYCRFDAVMECRLRCK